MPREMDDLDRALADDDPIVPSSGFAARVMQAVQYLATLLALGVQRTLLRR